MKNRLHFFVVFIMSLFFVPILSQAADYNVENTLSIAMAKGNEITLAETDEEGTNYYKFGSGSFETNLSEGATEEVAYIKWDEKLNISLLLDGKQLSYTSDDILFENGNYVAIIYDLESGEFTSMKFTIKNSLGMSNSANSNDKQTAPNDNNEKNEGSGSDIINDIGNLGDFSDFGASISSDDLFSLSNLEALQDMYSENDNKESYRLSISYKYDLENSKFVYSAAGKDIYITDVPNNAITNDSVYVQAADSAFIFVYKDGNVVFANGDNIYTEPGFYDVVSYIYNVDSDLIPEEERVAGTNSYETHFVFRIIGKEENNLGVVTAPDGFKIESVKYNEVPVELASTEYYFLGNDGRYTFDFVSEDNSLGYTVGFELDTVAPFIHFNQELYDNKAVAPLSYTVSEPGARVAVTTGSVSFNMQPTEEYYYSGWYHFKVSDNAGNARYYAVFVKEQYKFFSQGMIILLIAIIVLFAAYILIIRRGEYRVNEKPGEIEDELEDELLEEIDEKSDETDDE